MSYNWLDLLDRVGGAEGADMAVPIVNSTLDNNHNITWVRESGLLPGFPASFQMMHTDQINDRLQAYAENDIRLDGSMDIVPDFSCCAVAAAALRKAGPFGEQFGEGFG